MNLDEIGNFLGRVALGDNRDVGPAHILHWEELLPADLPYTDAIQALLHHRRTSTDYLQPAHIIAWWNTHREQVYRERLRAIGPPDYPTDLDQAGEAHWRRHWLAAIRAEHPNPTLAADSAMGIRRPHPHHQIAPADVRQAIEALAASKTLPEEAR